MFFDSDVDSSTWVCAATASSWSSQAIKSEVKVSLWFTLGSWFNFNNLVQSASTWMVCVPISSAVLIQVSLIRNSDVLGKFYSLIRSSLGVIEASSLYQSPALGFWIDLRINPQNGALSFLWLHKPSYQTTLVRFRWGTAWGLVIESETEATRHPKVNIYGGVCKVGLCISRVSVDKLRLTECFVAIFMNVNNRWLVLITVGSA